MKIFLIDLKPLLLFFISLNLSLTAETYNCVEFPDRLEKQFLINNIQYKAVEDCEDQRIHELGIPCEEVFYVGENQKESALYSYMSINADRYSVYNQKKAEQIFVDLKVYSQSTENLSEIISPEEIEANCFYLINKQGEMPFDKYNTFDFAGTSKRLYHHYFVMLPIENLKNFRQNEKANDKANDGIQDVQNEQEQLNLSDANIREITIDSIITTRFTDKDKSDYHLFKKLKTVMLFVQHFYQVLTDLIGVNNSACNYFSIPKDIEVPSSLYLRNNSFLQKLKKMFEEQNVESTEQKTIESPPIERKLHLLNRYNCNKFFMENPMIIPDVSINDFTLKIPEKNFKPTLLTTQDQENQNDESNYNIQNAFEQSDMYFRNFHEEALLSYVSISSHTVPEMLFKSSAMDKYQNDAFFKALKNKNSMAETSEHKYFYFLSEFYKLFNEMIDRYIMEGVVFYHCFKQQNKISLNNKCPVFLKILKRVMEHHKINVLHFLDLDVNYIYQNPKDIAFELETFMHMTQKMADFYIDKIELEDFNGFDVESFGTDYNQIAKINLDLENELKSDNFYEELVKKHNERYQNKKQVLIENIMHYFKGSIQKLNVQKEKAPDQSEAIQKSIELIRATYYHLKEKIEGVRQHNLNAFAGDPQDIYQLQHQMEKFLEEEQSKDIEKDKVHEKVIEIAKKILEKNVDANESIELKILI